LVRWFLKVIDEARIKIREEQLKGKKVTRFVGLTNLDGINAVTNVEPNSMPIYAEFAVGLVGHFPNMCDKLYLIRAGDISRTPAERARGNQGNQRG